MADLTEDEIDKLATRSAPFDPGPCRVCGGVLEMQAMGPGTYAAWACPTPEGVSSRDWADHYDGSRVETYRTGNYDVRALIAEVRRYRYIKSGDVARAFIDAYHEKPGFFDELTDNGPGWGPLTNSHRGADAVLALFDE